MFQDVLGKFIYDVDRENHLMAWRVIDQIGIADIVKISGAIKETVMSMPKGKVKIIADKRYSIDKQGHAIIFNKSVSNEWMLLQEWLVSHCTAVAVLCGTLVMNAQTNRLSQKSGSYTVLKSFYDRDADKCLRKAYTFLGIKGNKLVESPFVSEAFNEAGAVQVHRER